MYNRDPYGYPTQFGYQPQAQYVQPIGYPSGYNNPPLPAQYGASPYAYNVSRPQAREVRLYPYQEEYALQLPLTKLAADGKTKIRCTDAEKLIRFEQALHIEKAMVENRRSKGINKNFTTF